MKLPVMTLSIYLLFFIVFFIFMYILFFLLLECIFSKKSNRIIKADIS
ncbi:hypothetical protein CHCC20333_3468 [Bacillus paralicheniformis]|nr:hypothetical protein CHCC20333_3468 [Bacillus paralicheniformis]